MAILGRFNSIRLAALLATMLSVGAIQVSGQPKAEPPSILVYKTPT